MHLEDILGAATVPSVLAPQAIDDGRVRIVDDRQVLVESGAVVVVLVVLVVLALVVLLVVLLVVVRLLAHTRLRDTAAADAAACLRAASADAAATAAARLPISGPFIEKNTPKL